MMKLLIALAIVVTTGLAEARQVKEIARIAGQEEFQLRGIGLVVGLDGSGDSGAEAILSRPLAELYRSNGLPLADQSELEQSRSVALVSLSVTLPMSGARVGDRVDVAVSVLHTAESLEGGQLIIAPILGPFEDGRTYAIAGGPVRLTDRENPTSGVVRGGARVIENVRTLPDFGAVFDLIIEPRYASVVVSRTVAEEINQQYHLATRQVGQRIARAIDDRTVRIVVPGPERSEPEAFVADVLSTDVRGALRRVTARVDCDTVTGVILFDADVLINATALAHPDISIAPTVNLGGPNADEAADADDGFVPDAPEAPGRYVGIGSGLGEVEEAKLADLLNALRVLDLEPKKQIDIVRMLHESGKLHARLFIDGIEQ